MVKTDCKKLAINNPTKNFNKIDKLIASVLAKPSIDRKPAKDRQIRHDTHKQAKATPNFLRQLLTPGLDSPYTNVTIIATIPNIAIE